MSHRHILFSLCAFSLVFVGCKSKEKAQTIDYAAFVDPFIGTGAHGHTFPGATRPNAMVQLSPDTHLLGWEASSGYHDDDNVIYAFSHTHLSGTGIGDMGDVAVLPYSGADSLKPVATFDKKSEVAVPGYYKVALNNFNIQVELTSTDRVGVHRYKYINPSDRRIMLDLGHILQPNWGHKVVKNEVTMLNDSTIFGTYYTKGWAEHHRMSYYMVLNTKADSMALMRDGMREAVQYPMSLTDTADVKLHIYLPDGKEDVLVKVALSPVNPDGALKNLNEEMPGWNFDDIKEESRSQWNKTLSKISITTQDTAVLKNFYTAMYHMYIAPYNYQDVDGNYLGMDKQVHKQDSKNGHYTVFSIWDTYRALHPLLTIIDPTKAQKYGRSLISDYREGSIIPRWPLASNYTGCMPGYHSVSILADLVAKGLVDGEDLKEWAEAAYRTAIYRPDLDEKFKGTREHDLITKHNYYKDKYGFVPADSVHESVSWAVEMAYDDWCIARIAEAVGNDSLRKAYDEKAMFYKKYWDHETNLMRPIMSNGKFKTPFNPRYSTHGENDYTEGNAYQWSFYAPHDMDGFISLMGGNHILQANLDTLFTTSSELEGKPAGDITGLIGQYAHGNEPSHHIAYLYNWTKTPYKTQEILDSILYTFYKPAPDGIIGNEDCGQMSAWYVMNALGFYQVCPGKAEYIIGRPLVDEAVIPVKGGIFTIRVQGNSRSNKYVVSAKINGKPLSNNTFKHRDLKAGGLLEIKMSSSPNGK
ncbi:GH92 family glycosyl hydrolase [Porphyromonas pogonae]|uniref:GH92 family glycosyl hydrolase n=1 Tax=Porphyromonas pogonae TaxID=867595 RepID=UPI002E792147|nr:GH92 family glycosyl hydrolase [Porphyromonas pogonae]